MANKKQYKEMFDYLRGDRPPSSPESTVVFGRADKKVAETAGDLVMANLVDVLVITGGIGKDSGDIVSRGYDSEAEFLDEALRKDSIKRGYAIPYTMLDKEARNGGENARNSISILNGEDFDSDTMTAVAHATSARRLAETLKHAGTKINGRIPNVFVKPTDYKFNTDSVKDTEEARAELLRLADWPEKDWLLPQDDLPEDLVEFARDQQEK